MINSFDLRQHEQVVELHEAEAEALRHALSFYHRYLVVMSAERPLYREELLSIRPTTRLLTWLIRQLATGWPRDKRQRLKARRWRLAVEEVVLLNRLMRDGILFPMEHAHQNDFNCIYGRINQKALNLTRFFEL